MKKSTHIIRWWLWVGLVMVFVQVMIGGITRLTDSGLSITEWNIIKGVIPPLSSEEWQSAFEAYKRHAARQYNLLHEDMTLHAFKKIYYWEWFHRLWARTMGFVFIFPLIFFWIKGWITKRLWKQLGLIFFTAALAAVFGWIMVASGLNDDKRTWVNAYNLVIHLMIAAALFSIILWTILSLNSTMIKNEGLVRAYKLSKWILGLFIIQFIFGGLMAGMRAGLTFPYFPLWLKPSMTIGALSGPLTHIDFIDYEPAVAIKAWVQIIHRIIPLFLFWMLFRLYVFTSNYSGIFFRVVVMTCVALSVQYLLGITTVVLSKSGIPVFWGVIHQGMAFISLFFIINMLFRFKYR